MNTLPETPVKITMHTVDNFKPRFTANDPLIYESTSYVLFDGNSWRSIDADEADKEMAKIGKIPYSQKKLYLWNLAKA